jgi:RNA-binding protein YhbY
MKNQIEMQIGKNKLTKEFIMDIEKRTEKMSNANIKIKVLKNARESKADVKEYGEQIIQQLGPRYTYRVLGFIIFLKKWRKAR